MPRSRATASRLSRSAFGIGTPWARRSNKLGVALLARQPDPLDARQPPRIADIADKLVDSALELAGGMKASIDNGRDRLAGIGRLAGLLDEIDHVAAERRAVECAGEEPDDQAQSGSLVVADRQQMAFVGALRIGQRLALAVDHPADRHLFAALRLEPDLAVGGDRRRHVEHDRRFVQRRHRDRHRIGAEQAFAAAPGRQMIVAADREIEPDHVVLQAAW